MKTKSKILWSLACLLHMLGQEVVIYDVQQLNVNLHSVCRIRLNGVVIIIIPGYTRQIKITSH